MKLYRNDQKTMNWIGVKLVGGKKVNRDCFGCKAYFNQGDKTMLKEVDGGSGQASQSSRIMYYGLGDAKKLDHLKIDWGNGCQITYQNLKGGRIYEISIDDQIKSIKL